MTTPRRYLLRAPAGNGGQRRSLTGKSQLLSMAKALSRLIPNSDGRLTLVLRHRQHAALVATEHRRRKPGPGAVCRSYPPALSALFLRPLPRPPPGFGFGSGPGLGFAPGPGFGCGPPPPSLTV